MGDGKSTSTNGGGQRSARAFTLPSQPSSQSPRTSTEAQADHHHNHNHDHKHHKHRISHRHNRSHQVHTRESRSAHPQSSTSQLTDFFGPIRNVAGGIRELGSKNAGTFAEQPFKPTVFLRDKEKEKHVLRDNSLLQEQPEVTWETVKRARNLNELRDNELSTKLKSLASKAISQGASLSATHTALSNAINESSKLISQFSQLYSSTSTLLHEFMHNSAPELETSTRNQLMALERTYTQVEEQRLAALQARLTTASERMEGLRVRLEVCRKKVELEDARELEESRRHKKIMGLVTGAMGFVLMVVMILTVWTGEKNVISEVEDRDAEMLREQLKQNGVSWILDDVEHKENPGVDYNSKQDSGAESHTKQACGSGNTVTFADDSTIETDTLLARIFDEL